MYCPWLCHGQNGSFRSWNYWVIWLSHNRVESQRNANTCSKISMIETCLPYTRCNYHRQDWAKKEENARSKIEREGESTKRSSDLSTFSKSKIHRSEVLSSFSSGMSICIDWLVVARPSPKRGGRWLDKRDQGSGGTTTKRFLAFSNRKWILSNAETSGVGFCLRDAFSTSWLSLFFVHRGIAGRG